MVALGLRPRAAVILVPYLWLTIFFVVPCLIILKISLAQTLIAQPPYTPMLGPDSVPHEQLFDNFKRLGQDFLYIIAYGNSLKLAAISTVLCLLIGYPMAYGIARCSPSTRSLLLLAIILPFWTSFLIRVYAWMSILGKEGVYNKFLDAINYNWFAQNFNDLLIFLHVTSEPYLSLAPLQILYTPTAMYIGIVYAYLPFMILPLYSNLEKMDLSLLEAAADLGCRPFKAFCVITIPLSLPGIIAGSLLVFIPAVGEYVIPELLGGPDALMIGRVVYNEFSQNRDWPMSSAVAVAILLALVIPIMLFQYFQNKAQEAPK
ncbi:ABC transporter permease subunit [Dongia sp.]|uniref:ABC transporter permease subunit n=1 Tax=Dongia sp. TaxID=1977262 RepID=UPI0035B2130F